MVEAGTLEGLRALVTGGASGIGLATARLLSSRGATVAVVDRDEMIAAGPLHAIRADIADDDEVRAGVAEAATVLGGLDILVNNAAIGAAGTIVDNEDQEWRDVYEINVLGIVKVTRAALPYLRASKNAAVVNLSSIVATVGIPNRALYSATKGAVLSLSRAMAADHASEGIRVNCVTPGTTDTPWVQRLLAGTENPAGERDALIRLQPLGALISPAEVASAIVYLASPASSAITGVTLAVDGGMLNLHRRPAL